jgi:hypothetical protein
MVVVEAECFIVGEIFAQIVSDLGLKNKKTFYRQ